MSLRTRRLLVVPATLMFLVVACTGGAPTTAPSSPVAPATGGAPTDAAPTDAAPTDGAPTDGAPTDAAPTDGAPTDAAPTDAAPSGNLGADQTIRLYLSSEDPPTLDPNAASDTVSITILGNIHRGLMYWNQELEPVPAGAESVENNDDFSQFTFTLRQDAVFSDGSPIVAEDYVRSFKRLANPENAFDYGYMACFIAGTEVFAYCGADEDPGDIAGAVEAIGVTALDPYTLQVDLGQPATFFLSVMAMWLFVPLQEDFVNAGSFDEAAGYVGSGPYQMASWDHSSQVVLEANPNWYGDTMPTNTIQLNIGGDPDAALASYEQGNLDMVGVPGPQVRRILDDPTLSQEAVQLEALSIAYYNLGLCGLPDELKENRCPDSNATGNGKGPTQNLNFRIALTQSVDKQRMIDILRGGLGTPANTIVMPGIPGFDEEYNTNPPYPYDPAAAAAALETALAELEVTDADGDGEITAKDLGQLSLIYNSNAGHLPYIAFLAEAWRTTLGLQDLQLVGVDFSTLLRERGSGQHDVARNGWGADFPHAHNQLNDLFRCGGGNNDGNYCNPEFDALLDDAAQTIDLDEQTQKYIDAQRMLVDDAGALPLFFPVATYLVKPWVQNVSATNSDHTNPGDQFFETIQITDQRP
ncbi:peptide ABC transporter substrate-binding protein [soil metagenome]